ncbi:MAG TPA: EamA family transporter [Terriglobales bacterium]
MNFRKYLVLAGVSLFACIGDTLLARGMKATGNISLHQISSMILIVLNPGVALGIFFLLLFFACYLTALSWADLTYVLPATSLSYVLLTLVAKFYLHEHVSVTRWMGVIMISLGVGFVTQGPALTEKHAPAELEPEAAVAAIAGEVRR